MPIEALFMLTYGPSGSGKTLANIRAYSSGMFAGPRGCFLPAKGFLDIEVPVREINRLTDVIKLLKAVKGKRLPSLVISDVSILAEQECRMLRKPRSEGGEAITGWDTYNACEDRFLEIVGLAKDCPFHVALEFHEQPTREAKKTGRTVHIPACPQLPGIKLPAQAPGHFDLVAQIIEDDSLLSHYVWPYGFSVKPDGSAVRKDRTSSFPDSFPLNFREGLLSSGVNLPRHKDVVWMDEHVAAIANKIGELHYTGKFNEEHITSLLTDEAQKLEGKNPKHIRWVILDAFDAAEIARHKQDTVTNLIANLAKNSENDNE